MTQTGLLRIWAALAVAGVLFVGYCIRFDRKRRSDPDFKTKLRERRREQAAKEAAELAKVPDLSDPLDVQIFYFKELHQGAEEEMKAAPDYEKLVDHMANAFIVSQQQTQLLKTLEQTLPAAAFQRLLQKLPAVSQHVTGAQGRKQKAVAALLRRRGKQVEKAGAKLPDVPEVPSSYYQEELQQVEQLMAQQDHEKAADHLANAIAMCPNHVALARVLEPGMPALFFQNVLKKLAASGIHIVSTRGEKPDTAVVDGGEKVESSSPLEPMDAKAMAKIFLAGGTWNLPIDPKSIDPKSIDPKSY